MNRGKRADIQALRAIAVLAVVVYHFWPNRLVGGFMGVDIFFVISGYLMTTTLIRDARPVVEARKRLRATGSFLVNFYARRIKRLIPAASVTLLSTLGLVLLTGNSTLIQETAKQIISSSLFFQNWFLANNSVDYLANTNPTATQHFWSLSLEEQFYMIWPLLLLAILIVTANTFIVHKRERVMSVAILPIVLIAAGFFIFGYNLTQSQPSLAYFVTPARVWELLLGAAIAFLPTLKGYNLRLTLPWLGLVMIGYSLYRWGGEGFPGWHALIPTIGTALIIYGGGHSIKSTWSFDNLFKFRPIQWLGDISYSLYLWHWPLIILLPVLFYINLDTSPQSFLIKVSILIASLFFAQLSYRYVEQTTQHAKPKKRYIFISFIVITGLVSGISYFTYNHTKAIAQTAVRDLHSIILDDNDECTGAKSVFNSCDKSFGYVDTSYTQSASDDKYDNILLDSTTCSSYDGRKYGPTIGSFCTVGDLSSKHEVTVWGDSHAQHWINPMDKIGKRNNLKINIIGTSYCFGSIKYKANCDSRFSKIKASGIFERSMSIIVSMWHSVDAVNKGNNIANALDSLRSLTDNQNVFVLEDVPISGPKGGPDCTALHLACKNSIDQATGAISRDSTELVEIGAVTADHIISIKDIFCDKSYCYSNIGGIPVYRDKNIGTNKDSYNSHMTASFAYSTWPALEKKLKTVGAIR